MLLGISPVLSSDLLAALCDMGHGDEIAIVDANFTAATLGRRVLHLPGTSLRAACRAVLSVLPLDDFVEQPAAYMHVAGTASDYRSALQREVVDELEAAQLARAGQFLATERYAFYDRVGRAYAVVRTGELQPWANFLFRKGVIGEDLRP